MLSLLLLLLTSSRNPRVILKPIAYQATLYKLRARLFLPEGSTSTFFLNMLAVPSRCGIRARILRTLGGDLQPTRRVQCIALGLGLLGIAVSLYRSGNKLPRTSPDPLLACSLPEGSGYGHALLSTTGGAGYRLQ